MLCKNHYGALQRRFPSGLPPLPVHSVCLNCGAEFTATHRMVKWCKSSCGNAWRNTYGDQECSVNECSRKITAKALCRTHYRSTERAAGKIKPQVWNERRQENRERRRARMMGVYVGPKAPRFKIADRDDWLCGLCGDQIPRVVQHGHPLYLTIDHIIPLSKGGEHSPSNVQAAHATCNYSKGARELAA